MSVQKQGIQVALFPSHWTDLLVLRAGYAVWRWARTKDWRPLCMAGMLFAAAGICREAWANYRFWTGGFVEEAARTPFGGAAVYAVFSQNIHGIILVLLALALCTAGLLACRPFPERQPASLRWLSLLHLLLLGLLGIALLGERLFNEWFTQIGPWPRMGWFIAAVALTGWAALACPVKRAARRDAFPPGWVWPLLHQAVLLTALWFYNEWTLSFLVDVIQ